MRLNSIADINQTFLDLQGKIRNPDAIVDGVGIWSFTGVAQLKWWCQLKLKTALPALGVSLSKRGGLGEL